MCGIAGIYKFSSIPVEIGELKKMTDSIRHRGPDGEGHWIGIDKNIGLGHRRLSIIDLSVGGKQPMSVLDKYFITYNGEIYNYLELKTELKSKGYTFNSHSDTEVLLAMYVEYGADLLCRLDGMFAFAIWNQEKEQLFCARDRFGEKPFFYNITEQKFVFASEMKALWAYGVKKEINNSKIESFVLNGTIYEEKEPLFYSNIFSLKPGHFLIVSRDMHLQIRNYWDIKGIQQNKDIDFESACKTFRELLIHSIGIRLRSDVPIGSSLSGGLDSSTIVTLIDKIKNSNQKQKTFSARFKNFEKDEGKYIEEVANNCKSIESYFTWPQEKDLINEIENLVYHQEEPFGSASIFAQWKVMQLAKEQNVKVLLDGQGADEYLGGYLACQVIYIYQLFYENRNKYKYELQKFNDSKATNQKLNPFEKTETTRMKLGRWKKSVLGHKVDYLTLQDYLKNITTSQTGLGELLRYADRNSMAHSREIRLPFLSHRLVEFVFSLPDEYKINAGWTKYVLRKSMQNTLPEIITWRKDKIGYEPPQQTWLNHPDIVEIIHNQKNKFKIGSQKNNSYIDSMDWRLFLSYFFTK